MWSRAWSWARSTCSPLAGSRASWRSPARAPRTKATLILPGLVAAGRGGAGGARGHRRRGRSGGDVERIELGVVAVEVPHEQFPAARPWGCDPSAACRALRCFVTMAAPSSSTCSWPSSRASPIAPAVQVAVVAADAGQGVDVVQVAVVTSAPLVAILGGDLEPLAAVQVVQGVELGALHLLAARRLPGLVALAGQGAEDEGHPHPPGPRGGRPWRCRWGPWPSAPRTKR